jgi:DNA repair protein SbcC/Rad50
MILEKLTLNSFAGVYSREIELMPGMNVVCGPNEAGKSTLVKALKSALMFGTNLTPGKKTNFLSIVRPLSGGDTIQVTLQFRYKNGAYKLEKSWGGRDESRLILPSGNSITDADLVNCKLAEILGFNTATMNHVVFASQNNLKETIEKLRQDKDLLMPFQQLLLNMVIKQDGVNTELLKSNLMDKINGYFGNWDVALNRPKNNRDIDNPYKNGNGDITRAYYEYRGLEKQLLDIKQYERNIQAIVEQLQPLYSQIKALNEFIEEYKEAYQESRNNQTHLNRINELELQAQQSKADYDKWPQVETRIELRSETCKKLEAEIQNLEQERKIAQQRMEGVQKQAQYIKCKALNDRIEEKEESLAQMVKIDHKVLDTVQKLESRIHKMQVQIEAKKLKLEITANVDMVCQLQSGVDEIEKKQFSAGESHSMDANSRFRLVSDYLNIVAVSGEMDFDLDVAVNELQVLKQNIEVILKQHQSKDSIELKAKSEIYLSAVQNLSLLKKEWNQLLDGGHFEELEREVNALAQLPTTRSLEVLNREIEEKRVDHRGLTHETGVDQQQVKGYVQRYGSRENLQETVLNHMLEIMKLKEAMVKNTTLPTDFDDIQVFIQEYEQRKDQCQRIQAKITELNEAKLTLQREDPQIESREMEEKIKLARQIFADKVAYGKALWVIEKHLNGLLCKNEADTYRPYYQKTTDYFHQITLGRYSKLSMSQVNATSIDASGYDIPLELLSSGTEDALALAVRLSMAEFYLSEEPGFLVLDDPLVNIDPDRQQAAAACLQEFSKKHQVILLTCHPAHAEILGGEVIEMETLNI